MDFSITKALPEPIIRALFTTLTASLWQGLLLAVAAALIIVLTRKSSSARRYNLLVMAMMLFTLTVVTDFVNAYHQNTVVISGQSPSQQFTPTDHITAPTVAPQRQAGNIWATALNYARQNANMVVFIWLLVIFARSLQLLTGLQGLYHLKRSAVFNIDRLWEDHVKILGERLQISRAVRIAESGIAQVPMVIGHFKPLILIPVGLLTALPPAEIEAILIHELAHIGRRDYLVNLLLSLLEIVLFFNPAVLWISALIKTERENCCDDVAVAHTGSKVNYIRALVSCQEYQLSSPAYAMALSGQKNHLLKRVKRMAGQGNRSLNRIEKALLALCLVGAAMFTTAFSNKDQIRQLVSKASKAVGQVIHQPAKSPADTVKEALVLKEPALIKTDSLKKTKFRIYQLADVGEGTAVEFQNHGLTTHLIKQGGVLYQLNIKGGILSSMQVNGKTVAAADLKRHRSLINNILNKAERSSPDEPSEVAAADEQPVKVNANPANSVNLQAPLSQLKSRLQPISVPLDLHKQELGTLKNVVIADSISQIRSQVYTKPTYKGYAQSDLRASPQAPVYSRTEYKPYKPEKDNSNRDKIIDQMIKDGIIEKRDINLSFKLSEKEFIVNYKKQPDEVYQKYRAEYVKVTGQNEWSWLYNFDASTKTETNRTTVVTK